MIVTSEVCQALFASNANLSHFYDFPYPLTLAQSPPQLFNMKWLRLHFGPLISFVLANHLPFASKFSIMSRTVKYTSIP